jgi:hypothetical protein
MSVANVHPRADFFQALHEGRMQSAVLRELDIHAKSLALLLAGKPVSGDLMQKIARRLQKPLGELVVPPAHLTLTSETGYYESLAFGYFTDADWLGDGAAKWWRQEVSFVLREPAAADRPESTFRVLIRNQAGGEFQAVATLTNSRLLTLTATQRLASGREGTALGFQSVFRQQRGSTLCGVWCGLDPFQSRISVSRTLLSPAPLTRREITGLMESTPVEQRLDDVYEFGFEDP